MSEELINTVYIKRCEEYEPSRLQALVEEGMAATGFSPQGKVFVKPNLVVAHDPEKWGVHAYTHPALIEASLTALGNAQGVDRVDLGEKSAIGFPTRMCYRFAGYFDAAAKADRKSKAKIDIFCIDEERRDPVFIGALVHETLRVARRMARADTKVYLPKLKCHCVSNMTGTVKLNIGICSDDERSIRHDFLLDDKIVDLLGAGYPDFTVMDAIVVGVGNEGFPSPRKLGLILMGRNPIAVDMVAARLLGYQPDQIPYLKRAVERGYRPEKIDEVKIAGDLNSLEEVDQAAERIKPYDDEFFRWQDVNKELERLESPLRFYFGPYRGGNGDKCLYGCVMGLKMFLAAFEKYAGPEAFKNAKPCVFVIGKVDEEIDVKGSDAFLYGTCAKARLKNARKVIKIDKCFTTVSDMMIRTGARLGMPAPIQDFSYILPIAKGMMSASLRKMIKLRYAQDIAYFVSKRLERKL